MEIVMKYYLISIIVGVLIYFPVRHSSAKTGWLLVVMPGLPFLVLWVNLFNGFEGWRELRRYHLKALADAAPRN